MSERKLMDITHFQSECVVGYSRYAHIPISESSKLFTKYNLFEFIKQCYNNRSYASSFIILKNLHMKLIS